MLHESDLRKFTRCDKYFWYSKQNSLPFFSFATIQYDIFQLAAEYLGLENVFRGKRNDDPLLALEAYEKNQPLLEARIAYRDLRVKIPCFVRKDHKNILYLIYSQCYPKVSEAQKAADLIEVMAKNKMHVDEIYLIHINAQYTRDDELNVFECLTLSDEFYNDKNKKCGKASELIEQQRRDLDKILDAIETLPNMSQVQKKRSSICTSHYKCEYFKECFPDNQHDTSILNLVQSSKKYECEEMGITDMAMVHGDEIEATRIQYAQVMAAKKRGLFIDKMALKTWVDKVSYPITYLDFEWQTFAYPPYKGMKPYDVLVFQYSMHIEEKGQKLRHEQFIGDGDCRIAFIEDLLSKIPKEGTILVFNAQGAEALRLQQLAKQFNQYEEQLRSVWERMVDLALPFSSGLIYDTRMAGEYNLKKLLSLFSDLSYDELEINQGLLAVKKYQELEATHAEEVKKALFEYCGMDTYAEYVLFHFLKDKISETM